MAAHQSFEGALLDVLVGTSLFGRTNEEIMRAIVRKAEMTVLEKQHALELERLKPNPDPEIVSTLEGIIAYQLDFAARTKAKPSYDWTTYVSPTLGEAMAASMRRLSVAGSSRAKKITKDKEDVEGNTATQEPKNDDDGEKKTAD